MKKQTVMENSIKQFSSEIRNLQTELKTEQQKNFALENRFMTFKCRLKEILINDTKQNYHKDDGLCENQSTGVEFDSSHGKGGALLYLEKVHAYLQNIQMAGMFTFSDDESLAVSDEESWVL